MRFCQRMFVLLCFLCLLAPTVGAQILLEPPKPVEVKTVKVVDEAGQPVAGAKILVTASDTSWTGKATASAQIVKGETDAAGSFALPPGKPDSAIGVTVWAPGKGVSGLSRFNVVSAATSVKDGIYTAILRPAKPLRFRLVDRAGQPVAGATLAPIARLRTEEGKTEFTSLENLQELRSTPPLVSDADGWVTIDFVADGESAGLEIEKTGFQRLITSLQVPDDEELPLTLLPGATLRGRLVNAETGQPIAGEKLAMPPTGQLGRLPMPATDAEGRFVLAGIDEMEGALQLDSEEWVTAPNEYLTKRGETVDTGDIKVARARRVTGTVTGVTVDEANRRTYGGISIGARPADDKMRTWNRSTLADKDGRYTLLLPPGQFTLSAYYYQSGNPLKAKKEITVGGEALTVDLKLAPDEPQPVRRLIQPGAKPPPKPQVAKVITGKVIDGESGEPVMGAMVWLTLNRQKVRGTLSDDQGKFFIDRLPDQGENPATYIVSAEADGMVSSLISASPYIKDPLTIKMTTGDNFKVRIVNTAGEPIAGATVEATKFHYIGPENQGLIEVRTSALEGSTRSAKTGADGIATLTGLYSDCFASLDIKHPDYAPFLHIVALPQKGVPTLKLSREALFTGHVGLSDGRLLPVLPAGPWHVQAQTWNPPYHHRYADIDAAGNYTLHGVPSLELMESSWLSFLVDSKPESKTTVNGITTAYVPKDRGYNVLLTMEKDGHKEWWITFAEAAEAKIVYKEGETVKHDVVFQPLAYIKGHLTTSGGKEAGQYSISYHDPRSTYDDWSVQCDKDGNFEIPAPTGDVTLQLRTQEWGPRRDLIVVKDLKPQEVRSVEVKDDQPPRSPAAAMDARLTQTIMVRVVGPNGATVPRPRLSYPSSGGGTSTSYGELDGKITLYGAKGDTVEVTSPYLDKPFSVSTTDKKKIARVRFDRVPEKVPSLNRRSDYSPVREEMPADLDPPTPVAIGEQAPELVVKEWVSAKPVKLADLKGKVVLLNFSGGAGKSLENAFADKPFVIIRFLQPYMPTEGIEARPKSVIAIAKDPLTKERSGFNAQHFGADWGNVLIGPDGRIAARQLSGVYMKAKIEQLLSGIPPK